jgi:multidrug efflux pump subunit AcrA (membrane-fusion protein)
MDLALGQAVSNGQTGAILADLSALQVEIGLDESDIAQVSVGQGAIVTMDAFDDVELIGTITHIAPTAAAESGVVLYEVTVELEPTEIPVRVGMTADVEVVTSSAADALMIPLKAVRSVGGQSFVLRGLREGESAPEGPGNGTFVAPADDQLPEGVSVEDLQTQRLQMGATAGLDGFVMAPVQLGVMTDAYAEVLDGLVEGDVVAVSSSTASATTFGPGGFVMMGGRP